MVRYHRMLSGAQGLLLKLWGMRCLCQNKKYECTKNVFDVSQDLLFKNYSKLALSAVKHISLILSSWISHIVAA